MLLKPQNPACRACGLSANLLSGSGVGGAHSESVNIALHRALSLLEEARARPWRRRPAGSS